MPPRIAMLHARRLVAWGMGALLAGCAMSLPEPPPEVARLMAEAQARPYPDLAAIPRFTPPSPAAADAEAEGLVRARQALAREAARLSGRPAPPAPIAAPAPEARSPAPPAPPLAPPLVEDELRIESGAGELDEFLDWLMERYDRRLPSEPSGRN